MLQERQELAGMIFLTWKENFNLKPGPFLKYRKYKY